MLFKDILIQKDKELQKDFTKLFEDILKNQTHYGDLLLVYLNGNYYPEVKEWVNVEKQSPYVFGPTTDTHSYDLHYKFIHTYRIGAISSHTHPEYLKLHEWAEERQEEIDKLLFNEELTIQLEMLIYLKIWESDLFIKRFYQLTNLALGNPYDWHFSISKSSRDKKSTGTREKIIRIKVRDRIKKLYPQLYKVIKSAYGTQLRNSIAHSNYSFLGRNIHLNNYIKDDDNSQLKDISFDDWVDIFHDTMVLYDQMIGFFNHINEWYGKLSESNDLLIEIRVNKTDPHKSTEYLMLKFRPEYRIWNWNANE